VSPCSGRKGYAKFPGQPLGSETPFESTPRSVYRMLLESTPRRSGIGLDSSRVNTSIGLQDASRVNSSKKRYRSGPLSSQRLTEANRDWSLLSVFGRLIYPAGVYVPSGVGGHLFARSWCVHLFERFKCYTFITHAKGGSNSNKAKIIVVVVIVVIYYIRDIFTLCTVLVTGFIPSQ